MDVPKPKPPVKAVVETKKSPAPKAVKKNKKKVEKKEFVLEPHLTSKPFLDHPALLNFNKPETSN